jgi:hypothetical protein
MQTLKILTDRVNYENDLQMLRNNWIEEVFAFSGFDIELLNTLPRDKVIEFFMKNKIELIYFADLKALKIKLDGELIGEWDTPIIKLIDDNGIYYNEISINYWSIIDKQIDIKEN